MSELREKLAALAHEQWEDQMRHTIQCLKKDGYIHARMVTHPDVTWWMRLMDTPYKQLPPDDKERCRKWADRVNEIIKAAGAEHNAVADARAKEISAQWRTETFGQEASDE